MVKVLAISNLYPNAAQPRNGIFTENRLRALARSPVIEDVKVIAPLPRFRLPGWAGPYRHLQSVPATETRHGIAVHYPRYWNIPKIGMHVQPDLMARALVREMARIREAGYDFDVIDTFYFYPDGVAAAIAARHFDRPLVLTAYGNDLSLIAANSPRAARRIAWAAGEAKACTAVCQALADALVDLGVDRAKVHRVLHGVDLELFRPAADRAALRQRLGFDGPTLLTAGHLIERKGMRYAVEALADLPDHRLVIAGDGPEEAPLRALAEERGVADRVTFLGHVDQAQLRDYFAAADAFVLMSSREGIANVLMESMASGTPVLATAVWGAPEVITVPEAGRLVPERTGAALAREVQTLFADMPDRAATRRYAETYSWADTTAAHLKAYETFLGPLG